MTRRSRRTLRAGTPARRRVISYVTVTATAALVLALAGGGALAATSSIHYKQKHMHHSKPTVKTGPTGPAGAPGAAGATGATGATGIQGNVGPQGPGATVFTATESVGQVSSATGAIPIELACDNVGGSSPAPVLLTTATHGGSFPITHDGYTYSAWQEAAPSGGINVGSPKTTSVEFGASGTTEIAEAADNGDLSTGTALLVEYNNDALFDTTTTETVDFVLTDTGSNSSGSCSVVAQIVSGSVTSHLEI